MRWNCSRRAPTGSGTCSRNGSPARGRHLHHAAVATLARRPPACARSGRIPQRAIARRCLSIRQAVVRVAGERVQPRPSGCPAAAAEKGSTMNDVRTLLTGRGLVESPRWHGGRLYFSDWSAGEVIAVDLAGRSEVIARVDSLPLCTAFLPGGRLVIVSSPDGRLLRREPDGSLVTHADLGQPGWNDIVADGRGNIYVNRAGFNPMAGEAVPAGVRLPRRRGRCGAGGGRRHRLPQRDGGHRRQLHPDRRGLLRPQLVALLYRPRRRAVRPTGLGRPRRGHPRRHLHRRRERRLVRRRAPPAVRARRRGRHGAADRRTGPRAVSPARSAGRRTRPCSSPPRNGGA